jgi:hypothetical protein
MAEPAGISGIEPARWPGKARALALGQQAVGIKRHATDNLAGTAK